MKYYIIAGEASGDLHGSNLMKGLYRKDLGAHIRFWGGDLMREVYSGNECEDGGLVRHYGDSAVIGFSAVLTSLGKFAKRLALCEEDIVSFHPDVVILVDYPGFNFKVAKFAHEKGFKVFYYIAPKVWASRESRIKKLKQWVDRLFIVFPFEIPYFERHGVPFTYEGNPLLDAVDSSPALKESREEFISRTSLPKEPYIAILAGSRKGEVSSMMPVCIRFAKALRSTPGYGNYHFVIAGAPSRGMEDYEPHIGDASEYVHVVFRETYGVLRHSEAAVINSGTASLEACLIGTPQVVAYAGSNFNYRIGRLIIRVDMISLGNLILGRKAFRELIQYYFTPRNVLTEIRRILEDEQYREGMKRDYSEIRTLLGGGGASERVSEAIFKELEGKQ